MKKSLLLLFVFPLSLFAQNETGEKEKKEQKEKTENEASDRIVIGFSFDNWIHNIDSLSTKWNSWGFHFYYMYDVPLGT
ncbi:MAG TPA: hypothetical protein VNJ07_01320, partial [Chitinophagales bacterium]|nr:hypothetical protein [Chitinophagales bacterium]